MDTLGTGGCNTWTCFVTSHAVIIRQTLKVLIWYRWQEATPSQCDRIEQQNELHRFLKDGCLFCLRTYSNHLILLIWTALHTSAALKQYLSLSLGMSMLMKCLKCCTKVGHFGHFAFVVDVWRGLLPVLALNGQMCLSIIFMLGWLHWSHSKLGGPRSWGLKTIAPQCMYSTSGEGSARSPLWYMKLCLSSEKGGPLLATAQ